MESYAGARQKGCGRAIADNVVLNAGSGGVTALTDDCTTGHAQIVKLAISTDGSATLIPATAAAGMLVDQSDDATRDNGIMTVDNGGTFAVQVDGSALTALQLIDDVVKTDDAAFTPATDKVAMVGAEFDDTTPDSVDEGDAGALRMSANRNLYVRIRDNAGNERGLNIDANGEFQISGTRNALPVTDNSGSLTVDNGGTFVVQENGAALTALQLIDDTVKTLGTDTYTEATSKGLVVGAVRRDADTTLADTTNEFAPLQVDANGRLKVEVFDGGDSHTVDNGGTFAVQESGGALTALQIMDDWDNAASDGASVSGDVAHDTADAGEPVKIGAFAETAPSGRTPVADGDRTNLIAGADGVLIVRPYCGLEDIVSGVDTDTAGDSSSVISAPGAGIRLYITSVIVKNSHASTDAYVDIRDGTAGSVLASIPAPAAGGAVVNFPVPLRLTANTACAVDPSAAVTTIITTVVGFKAAV